MGPGKIDLGPGKGGRYNIFRSAIMHPNVLLDISRAKELGYKPKPIEKSIEEYASWIKEELKS